MRGSKNFAFLAFPGFLFILLIIINYELIFEVDRNVKENAQIKFSAGEYRKSAGFIAKHGSNSYWMSRAECNADKIAVFENKEFAGDIILYGSHMAGLQTANGSVVCNEFKATAAAKRELLFFVLIYYPILMIVFYFARRFGRADE